MATPFNPTGEQRSNFWQGLHAFTDEGCWKWQRHLHDGYGRISLGFGKSIKAHRFSLALFTGAIPDAPNNHALHGPCNDRSCVNPSHLSWGSNRDNINDRLSYGVVIRKKGEVNPFAKLTEAKVLEMLSRREEGSLALSLAYGINRMYVNAILRGDAWPHLQPIKPPLSVKAATRRRNKLLNVNG